MNHLRGIRLAEIGEHDDCQLVVHVVGDMRFESLLRSAMSDKTAATNLDDLPAEPISAHDAVVQPNRREHSPI